MLHHVEVYEDNDPANGFNCWMQEEAPTEPWTFLVDRTGAIVDRFEALSGDRLEDAVRASSSSAAAPRPRSAFRGLRATETFALRILRRSVCADALGQ